MEKEKKSASDFSHIQHLAISFIQRILINRLFVCVFKLWLLFVCVSLAVTINSRRNKCHVWFCSIFIFTKGSRLTDWWAKLPVMKNNKIKQNVKTIRLEPFPGETIVNVWLGLCFHLTLWFWKGYWKEWQLHGCLWNTARSSRRQPRTASA